MTDESDENEGEGSRTAAKAYNDKTKEFVESGKVETQAKDAAKALDGEEAESLRQAEKEGLSKIRGEDPQIHLGK